MKPLIPVVLLVGGCYWGAGHAVLFPAKPPLPSSPVVEEILNGCSGFTAGFPNAPRVQNITAISRYSTSVNDAAVVHFQWDVEGQEPEEHTPNNANALLRYSSSAKSWHAEDIYWTENGQEFTCAKK